MTASTGTQRAAGFYVTLAAAAMCLASAILYRADFQGMIYSHGALFSEGVFWGLIAAAAVAIAMLFLRLEGYAPVVLCIASGLSCLAFIHRMVWPVADIFTAIDPVTFISQLITCAAVLLASFVLSEVALYMKKRKVA